MRPRFTKEEEQEIDQVLKDPNKIVFTYLPRNTDQEKWYFVIGKSDTRLLVLYCADDFGVMFLRDAMTEEQFTYHYAPPRKDYFPKIT